MISKDPAGVGVPDAQRSAEDEGCVVGETPAQAHDVAAPYPDADIEDAIEGHARFRAAFEKDRAFFRDLATTKQKPRLLWIGCSDSRVVPAQITGADPGELFEIRNIANSVPPADSFDDSVGAAIEYAIEHLGIDDIVVCGHTGCGGVAALIEGDAIGDDTHLARWVDLTRPAHALIRAAGVDGPERADETAKAHVQFQIDNLMTYAIVADGVASGRITVHGWLYDMHEGRLFAYDSADGAWRDLLGEGS
ncbi:MAG: hypothetical protein KDJ37_14805 [Hyphomicrobiaceae bacterium]|nr:hypothetical protein [Hyphomicrobiaceae bacterium]